MQGTADGSCTDKMVNGCRTFQCQASGQGSLQFMSAGNITISGGSIAPVVLKPDQQGKYAQFTDTKTRWNPGDKITISAAGAMIPRFSSELVVPNELVIKSPTVNLGESVKINRDKGFVAQWDPSAMSNSVAISIFQAAFNKANNTAVFLSCEFTTTAGTGTVTPDVLRNLKPSMGGIITTVAIAGSNGKYVTAGGLTVAIGVMIGGLNGLADVH